MSYQKICLLETDYLAPVLQLVLVLAGEKGSMKEAREQDRA